MNRTKRKLSDISEAFNRSEYEGADDYVDYKVGVNYNLLGILAEVDVVGTNVSTSGMSDNAKKPYDTGVLFSLTKTF